MNCMTRNCPIRQCLAAGGHDCDAILCSQKSNSGTCSRNERVVSQLRLFLCGPAGIERYASRMIEKLLGSDMEERKT